MVWKTILASALALIGATLIQIAHKIAPEKAVVKDITTHVRTIPALSGTPATVAKVIDGDTIEISTGERVRYIGIDTPEIRPKSGGDPECFSGEAAARNTELVFQKEVTLVQDKENTDSYGRLLRYVYVGDTFVNKVLVEDGYAYAKEYRPNTAKHKELSQAMSDAQSARRGMWGECK